MVAGRLSFVFFSYALKSVAIGARVMFCYRGARLSERAKVLAIRAKKSPRWKIPEGFFD
jgi:hypothetical protein